MHIKKLRMERFGAYADLQIDSLTEGLNVFHGPPGSGKSTLVHFLRAMFGGFPDDIRRGFLAGEAYGSGGTLTLAGPSGEFVVSRYDDGSLDGRLTLQDGAGRPVAAREFRDWFPGILPSTYASLFAIDFNRRPEIGTLLEEARRLGAELQVAKADALRQAEVDESLRRHRDQLAGLADPRETLESLRSTRQHLAEEIESLVARGAAAAADIRNRRARLLEAIAQAQYELDKLRTELADVERAQHDLQTRRAETSQRRPGPGDSSSELDERLARLRGLEARLDRWREVLADIAQRRQTLQADSENPSSSGSTTGSDPRHLLRSLESHLRDLSTLVAKLSAERVACQCGSLREVLPTAIEAMREDIYRLCRELNGWQMHAQQRECNGELAQLARCEAELEASLRGLVAHRNSLIEEISQCEPGRTALPEWEERLCGCSAHPRLAARITPNERTSPDLVWLENELDRLARRHEKLLHDIDEVEVDLSDSRKMLHDLDHSTVAGPDEACLAEPRAALRRVEDELRIVQRREELRQVIAQLEHEAARLARVRRGSDLLQEAEGLLRRMSAANLVGLQLDERDALQVVDEYGVRRGYNDLAAGQRSLVYLSLCLAVVAHLGRRGLSCPLILGNLFTHVDSKIVPEAAELLRDFASSGRQVLVLTRFDHVASVFRLLNVRVRRLEALPRSESRHAAIAGDAANNARVAQEKIDAEDRLDHAFRLWDAEEFPGELADRVRRRVGDATRDGSRTGDVAGDVSLVRGGETNRGVLARQADGPEYALTEAHPLAEAPSIDPVNADRLRKIGILRVGDLLKVSAADAATELRHAGVTAEMIANWQAQARLVCRIPRLRPYDARILVACGITSPEALSRMTAHELRDLVRQFAASSAGQAILLSGTEHELSRVTEWIKTAQRTPEPSGVHDPGRQRLPDATSEDRGGKPAGGRQARSVPSPSLGDSESERRSAAGRTSEGGRILRMPDRSQWKFYLDRSSPVIDAPSVGPRTAEQLAAVGIRTVQEFLQAEPAALAAKLHNRRMTEEAIRQWQQQTILACRVPQLRGHDAQILVAVGVTDPEQLAVANADELWSRVRRFVQTKEGKRLVRNGKDPDLLEVRDWIEWASAARALHAA